jgi:L-lactate dehydrogenase complex protein LldG
MLETGSTLAAAFTTRASRLGVTVHQVEADLAPATVAEIAQKVDARRAAVASNVPGRAAMVRLLAERSSVLIEPAALRPDVRADLGVSVARLAVAETGSLLVHSSAADRRAELCVDVHVVLVAASDLRATLDEALQRIRDISAGGRSYVSLLTGPSRSSDIELQPAVGVHGPREVHIILMGAA